MRLTGAAVAAVALVLALTLLSAPVPARAIEAKCSACEAVAAALQDALESERPRNHLDMRGRLDSKGVRYGKMIDYKVSELRFFELLEDLCSNVGDNYQLLDANATAHTPRRWARSVRIGGKGSKGPKGPKAKAQRAEIEQYCNRIVEEQEEGLQQALVSKELDATNVDDHMCRRLSKECKGKKRKPPPPPEPEAGAGEGADADAAAEPSKGKKGKKGKKGSKAPGDHAATAEQVSELRDSLPKEEL